MAAIGKMPTRPQQRAAIASPLVPGVGTGSNDREPDEGIAPVGGSPIPAGTVHGAGAPGGIIGGGAG